MPSESTIEEISIVDFHCFAVNRETAYNKTMVAERQTRCLTLVVIFQLPKLNLRLIYTILFLLSKGKNITHGIRGLFVRSIV